MPLTILSDRDVERVLLSLTKKDVLELQESLGDALHWYSTSQDANDYCSDFQPERLHLKRKDGSMTLFMPASGIQGQGVKVVNVSPPESEVTQAARAGHGSADAQTPDRNKVSAPNPEATESVGHSKPVSTIRGSITLLDPQGRTTGLLNAEEVTAFRTALASSLLLPRRQSVDTLTVFGAGKQAHWHIRLALLLRGDEIKHLNVITRSFDSATKCLQRLYNPLPSDPTYVNTIGELSDSKTEQSIITPSHVEYERLLKEAVHDSNVIYCTVPSSTPLFPASYLTNPEGRKKGRYIACIGSYQPHMVELDPDVLTDAVAPHHQHGRVHRRQKEGGAVIVDTLSGCMREAGEIIQAGLRPDQLVEVGELIMLKKERDSADEEVQGCALQEKQFSGLKEWIERGNVIFKLVGLGLLDLVAGNEILRLAKERAIGLDVEHF